MINSMKEGSEQKHIQDLCRRYRGSLLLTGFLTPADQLIAQQAAKQLPHAFWGGYDQAQRCMLALLPEEWTPRQQEYIAALSIRAPFAKRKLEHRDYLGSLLGLGMERTCLGDILVQEEGATCFVQRHMAAFVMDNLLKVGSCAVHVEEVPLPEAVEQETAEEFSATVAQLRLDSVVAAAFRVSRTKAAEYIAAGAVKHNHLPCLDRDKSLQEGDVLSLRGFGRATLLQVGGRSKKDRIFITVTRP